MKKYLKFFTIPFIVVGIITVLCLGIYFTKKAPAADKPVKGNTQSDLNSNVFNYAGNLSDDKVAQLDSYIAQIEEETGIDIAVVTLDESLEDYVKKYESQLSYSVTPRQWVMVYADNFADEHKMGYDEPYGSSIVFVDNLHREESTGKVYSWISTSGYAQNEISEDECEAIMDVALANLSDSSSSEAYYQAYKDVVRLIPSKIAGSGYVSDEGIFSTKFILLLAAVVAGLFILVNIKSKIGDKTTNAATYVVGGQPNMKNTSDVFLRKTVSKTKIESNSGSGGSGGHSSAGGHSHGGGGHSR